MTDCRLSSSRISAGAVGWSDWGDAGFGKVGAEVSGAESVVLFLYERASQCARFVVLPIEQREDDTDWIWQQVV